MSGLPLFLDMPESISCYWYIPLH